MNNPESRRAMRSIAQVVIVGILVGFLWRLIGLLVNHPNDLSHIAMALCAIVGLFVALVGAETVGRVMIEFGSAKAEMGGDDEKP